MAKKSKAVKKPTKKPVKKKAATLASKVEIYLAKNSGQTFTFAQVAKKLKVKAISVANTSRTIRKTNPSLAVYLVPASATAPKTNSATVTA